MWSWLGGGGLGSSSSGVVVVADGNTDASTSLTGSSPLSSGAAPQSGAVFQLTERVLAFVYGASDGGNERGRRSEKERKLELLFFRSMMVPADCADVDFLFFSTWTKKTHTHAEEDAASWQEAVHLSALSPRYRAALEGAATALKTAVAAVAASRGGGGGGGSRRRTGDNAAAPSPQPPPPPPPAGSALVLNLGPAWSSASAYALFDDAVIELPFRDWEGPPGLCSPPLDVLFAVAEATSKWLSTSPDAVALLCVRARSGGGAATARFVAACHAVYNADARTVAEALAQLPPPPPRARGWSTFCSFAPSALSPPPQTTAVSSPRTTAAVFSGPAQARYGSYFDGLLHSRSAEELDGAQATARRVLRSVSLRGFEALDLAACSSSSSTAAGAGGGGSGSEAAGIGTLAGLGLGGVGSALTGSLTGS